MVLSDLGILAKYSWHEITNHCNSVELDAFVIMPNHVHGILLLTGNEKSGVDELGCHNDDGGAVETRHALSLLITNIDTDVGVPAVETRHALSLLNANADNDVGVPAVETRHALSLLIANADNDVGVPAVETRHALSPLNANADNDVGVGVPGNEQETRHALSLPSYRQNLMKPGQCRFRNQGKKTISSIVGSYKSAISRHAHRLGLNFNWQSRFHDHVIRNDGAYQRIAEYIQNNPSNWQDDQFYME